MPRKRHKPEEIVAKLRQVDVLVSQGQSAADAVRSIGVTEVTQRNCNAVDLRFYYVHFGPPRFRTSLCCKTFSDGLPKPMNPM